MNIHYCFGFMLFCIVIINMLNISDIEGIHNPVSDNNSPGNYSEFNPSSVPSSVPSTSTPHIPSNKHKQKNVVSSMCEGGFVLAGFPSTML